MTRPVWLIEADVYGPEVGPLADEVRRQGMACGFVRHRELVKGPPPGVDGRTLTSGDCVIVYGTYPTVRQAQLHSGWVPAGWLDPDALDCAAYYPHFEPYLLNRRHEILPEVEALRDADRLFEEFGVGGEVFARPTGVHKLFVGRRISRGQWESALAPTRYDPATTVLVAPPVPIGREWRVVVAGDEVVAVSQYADIGVREVAPGCPPEVTAFVRDMLAAVRWRPDELFMMDVGETDGRLRVIELNAFSCSWLYACDFAAVVRAASGLAAAAWRRVRG
jgi:hypothetical protein